MFDEPARKAITAALSNEWELARKLNLRIIKDTPDDVNALNRLAQAHLKLGNLAKSEVVIRKILKIDPLNSLAEKCGIKINFIKRFQHKNNNLELRLTQKLADPNLFIEAPGKTKLVSLINTCEPNFLATLSAGEYIVMTIRKPKVVISTVNNADYLGRLPDDLASRIIFLENIGNKYEAFIKSVTLSEIQIFIRETYTNSSDGSASFPIKR